MPVLKYYMRCRLCGHEAFRHSGDGKCRGVDKFTVKANGKYTYTGSEYCSCKNLELIYSRTNEFQWKL